jgi:hypothetical protein
MSDEPQRRRADLALGTRMTVVEVEMRGLGRRMDEHIAESIRIHADLSRLIAKLDLRADRQDVQFARLLAGLSVVIVVAQFVAPILLRTLGLPT